MLKAIRLSTTRIFFARILLATRSPIPAFFSAVFGKTQQKQQIYEQMFLFLPVVQNLLKTCAQLRFNSQ